MAVGISQIKNVDTMARKVCASLKFPFPLSLAVCVAWEIKDERGSSNMICHCLLSLVSQGKLRSYALPLRWKCRWMASS